VVEQGTFAELMTANGRLTQLWQAQKREENGPA
jgi:ABC-type multidrug transport system fused ATPase/permease subunit